MTTLLAATEFSICWR